MKKGIFLLLIFTNYFFAAAIDMRPLSEREITQMENNSELLEAAHYNDLDAVKRLILNGADVNFASVYDLRPLHWAALNGNLEMVQALVNVGADVTACKNDRVQPLHYAVSFNHYSVAQFLIENGADVHTTTRGYTLLASAIAKRNVPRIRFLCSMGACYNEQVKNEVAAIICEKHKKCGSNEDDYLQELDACSACIDDVISEQTERDIQELRQNLGNLHLEESEWQLIELSELQLSDGDVAVPPVEQARLPEEEVQQPWYQFWEG